MTTQAELAAQLIEVVAQLNKVRGEVVSALTRIIKDVDVTRPNTPTGLSGTPVSETQINLSWNAATDPSGLANEAVTGVVGYRLYRNSALRIDQAGLTFNDTALSAYTVYSYQVSAYDAAGNESILSTAIVPRTLDTTAPTAPTITASATSSSSISVALTTPSTDSLSGVATYRLEYKATASPTWILVSASLTAASFPRVISGLTASTQHDTRCSATDLSGNTGSFSATSQATTQSSGASLWSYALPTQANEQALYDNILSWAWTAGDKTPDFAASYGGPTTQHSYDPHQDGEGDDLWSHYQAYLRTGNTLHRTWAQGWRNYFVSGAYRADLTFDFGSGASEATNWLYDHLYGQGLVLWHHYENDPAALTEAANIAALIESFHASHTPGSYTPAYWGSRGPARHLILATYLAEKSGQAQWITLRNKLIDIWVQAPEWSTGVVGGNYFCGRDQSVSAGITTAQYDAGRRSQSAFQIALHYEALWRAYLATGRADVRTKLENISWWVAYYAHDPTYVNPMVGAWLGHEISTGARWHREGDSGNANISGADPVYDTALVNVLVRGYKLTGYYPMLNLAYKLWRNGTIYPPGQTGQAKLVADTDVHHYADTRRDPDPAVFNYNKGEIQYVSDLFENGGIPSVITRASTSALATQIAAAPIDTYTQLTGVGNISILNDSNPGGTGLVLPYADYCPWDPITRRAYFCGADDPGVDGGFRCYDEATNAFVALASQPVNGHHMYSGQSVDPLNRYLWINSSTQGDGRTIMRYNLQSGATTTITIPSGTSGAFNGPATLYFPDRQGIYFAAVEGLWFRANTASSWTLVTSGWSSHDYHMILAYNPRYRCMILAGGNATGTLVHRINLDGTVTLLSAAPVGLGCPWAEFVFDPPTGEFIVFVGGDPAGSTNRRYRFNPSGSGTWTNLGTAGVPAALFGSGPFDNELKNLATVIPEYKAQMHWIGSSGFGASVWFRRYA